MHQVSHKNALLTQLQDIHDVADAVARGVLVSVGISGAPGIGKTFTVNRSIRRAQKKTGINIPVEVYSDATTAALIQKLWDFRQGGILILDDADQLLTGGGERQANLMKKVLDKDPVREIVSDSCRAQSGQGAPPRFMTRAQVIWIGNTDLDNPVGLPKKILPHIQAMRSRLSFYLPMANDPSCALDYVLWLGTTKGMLANEGFKRAEVSDAVHWFVDHAEYLREISARCLVHVAKLRKSFPQKWERMARSTCLQAQARVGLVLPPVPWNKVVHVPVTAPISAPPAPPAPPPETPDPPPPASPPAAPKPSAPTTDTTATASARPLRCAANSNVVPSAAATVVTQPKKETPAQKIRRLEYENRDLKQERWIVLEEMVTYYDLYRETQRGMAHSNPNVEAARALIGCPATNDNDAAKGAVEDTGRRIDSIVNELLFRGAKR
jgi:hypothetical protein